LSGEITSTTLFFSSSEIKAGWMSINNVQRAHLRGTRQQPSLCFPLDILPALCVNHNYPTNSPFTVISPPFFSRNNAATSHTHTRKQKKGVGKKTMGSHFSLVRETKGIEGNITSS
jgi:hypothetical protein